MRLQTSTSINIIFENIPTCDGKIKIDDSTQLILKSFLTEYGIEPKNWRQVVENWYMDYSFVSLKDLDKTALMEFTVRFKLFLLDQVREILDIEQKAFAEFYGK